MTLSRPSKYDIRLLIRSKQEYPEIVNIMNEAVAKMLSGKGAQRIIRFRVVEKV